jgi:cystathionine beta-lyase/cystathionine gamma-synthase
MLRVVDLAALAELAAAHDARMVADNTLATPLLQQPFDLGSSANVYSLTKALGGHSDLLLGAVVSRDQDLIVRLREWRTLVGAIPGAFAAWLAARSLKTLAVRLQRQCENAMAIAEFLANHERVTAVHYPGLSPAREVADRQMHGGYGPVLSFEVDGDARRLAATGELALDVDTVALDRDVVHLRGRVLHHERDPTGRRRERVLLEGEVAAGVRRNLERRRLGGRRRARRAGRDT